MMDVSVSRKMTWLTGIALVVVFLSLLGMHVLMSAMMGPVTGLETKRIVVDQGLESEALYQVEVATDAALSVGLMNRTEPPGPSEGMLFDWGDVDYRAMTMYNTRFPVKVLWLDEGYNVLSTDAMEPCPQWRLFFCPEYESPEPVRFALEVPLRVE